MQRTGWVWRKVKNPETVAEHSFRAAFFAWILGASSGLRVGKMVELALLHDVCESFAGDLTPYYGMIPKDTKTRDLMASRWIRLPQKKKKALTEKREALEKKALLKLIKPLGKKTQQAVFSLWQEFEYGLSPEAKFVRQVDKIEAMLQGIEYFGTGRETVVKSWWEQIEELVEHPVIAKFVKGIEHHLYYKERTDVDNLIDFLTIVGKLKRKPRPIWVLRKVKNPSSEANHAFMLGIMCWLFIKELGTKLNMEKVLKMSICSRLGFAVLPDPLTRYDKVLAGVTAPKTKEQILKGWIRHSIKEKKQLSLAQYKKERDAVKNVTAMLNPPLKREILFLWDEFKKNQSPEAQLVNQVQILEQLFQALEYWSQDKNFAIEPWWEMGFEHSASDLNLDFMAALKKHFYRGKK